MTNFFPSSRYLFWFDREFAVSPVCAADVPKLFERRNMYNTASSLSLPFGAPHIFDLTTYYTRTDFHIHGFSQYLLITTNRSRTPHHRKPRTNHVSKRQLDSQVFPLLLGHTRGYGTQRTVSRIRSTRWTSRLGGKSTIILSRISLVANSSSMMEPLYYDRGSAWKKTSELV